MWTVNSKRIAIGTMGILAIVSTLNNPRLKARDSGSTEVD
jgi:hypothetical protein